MIFVLFLNLRRSRILVAGLDGLAAFVWSQRENSSCELVHRGEKFVIVHCMNTLMVACYCSPNVDISSFLDLLDGIQFFINNTRILKEFGDSFLICGD